MTMTISARRAGLSSHDRAVPAPRGGSVLSPRNQERLGTHLRDLISENVLPRRVTGGLIGYRSYPHTALMQMHSSTGRVLEPSFDAIARHPIHPWRLPQRCRRYVAPNLRPARACWLLSLHSSAKPRRGSQVGPVDTLPVPRPGIRSSSSHPCGRALRPFDFGSGRNSTPSSSKAISTRRLISNPTGSRASIRTIDRVLTLAFRQALSE